MGREPENATLRLLREMRAENQAGFAALQREVRILRDDVRDLREREAHRGLDHARLDANDRAQRDRLADVEHRLDALEAAGGAT